VSTFRLEPEHFILTTGTFNLIVKDRIAFRLSGAPSVRTEPLAGSRTSSKPFNRIVSRELLSTLYNHRISTCYPQRGAAIQARKTQARRTLCPIRQDNATTLFRLQWQRLFDACRSGRRSNLKRSLGGSAFRETLQELCSRMRTPRLGVNWRLSLFDARVADTIQTNSDTQTDVLGFKVYSRSTEIVQGGIKNVT
jgi:hypothetical protein